MPMSHALTHGAISGNRYLTVQDDRFRGVFHTYPGNDDPVAVASLATLRNAPTGWIADAEQHLDAHGFDAL